MSDNLVKDFLTDAAATRVATEPLRKEMEALRQQQALDKELERSKREQEASWRRQDEEREAQERRRAEQANQEIQQRKLNIEQRRLEEERAFRESEQEKASLRTGLGAVSEDFQEEWLNINRELEKSRATADEAYSALLAIDEKLSSLDSQQHHIDTELEEEFREVTAGTRPVPSSLDFDDQNKQVAAVQILGQIFEDAKCLAIEGKGPVPFPFNSNHDERRTKALDPQRLGRVMGDVEEDRIQKPLSAVQIILAAQKIMCWEIPAIRQLEELPTPNSKSLFQWGGSVLAFALAMGIMFALIGAEYDDTSTLRGSLIPLAIAIPVSLVLFIRGISRRMMEKRVAQWQDKYFEKCRTLSEKIDAFFCTLEALTLAEAPKNMSAGKYVELDPIHACWTASRWHMVGSNLECAADALVSRLLQELKRRYVAHRQGENDQIEKRNAIDQQRQALLEEKEKATKKSQIADEQNRTVLKKYIYLKSEIKKVGQEIRGGLRIVKVPIELLRCSFCRSPVSPETDKCPYCNGSL